MAENRKNIYLFKAINVLENSCKILLLLTCKILYSAGWLQWASQVYQSLSATWTIQ